MDRETARQTEIGQRPAQNAKLAASSWNTWSFGLLSGTPLPADLASLLASLTPDPQPSGDQPPQSSQLRTLANYAPLPWPPYTGPDPAVTQFVADFGAVEDAIQANPAARPAFWGETVADAPNQYRLHLDDNGMLLFQWTIDWGDGSQPQVVLPQPWLVHQYAAAGQYMIVVTAMSHDGIYTGQSSTGFADFAGIGGSGNYQAWLASAPTISGLHNTCPEGTLVNLVANASVDSCLTDPVAYDWQILDSSGDTVAQSTDPNFNYTFTAPDTYTVSLVASVDAVTSVPATATITVSDLGTDNSWAPSVRVTANVGQTYHASPGVLHRPRPVEHAHRHD